MLLCRRINLCVVRERNAMSGGSSNEAVQVLGSSAVVTGGAVLLPNTGNSDAAMIIAIIAIVAGALVIVSAITRRLVTRFSK